MLLPSPTSPAAGAGRALVLRALFGITGPDAETRSSWSQIAKCGEWKGHPAGDFTITAEHLAAIVECFEAQQNPICVDYEHASTLEGEEAPASGWVQRLELRAEGQELWGFIEWTERGANYIRAGEYRYLSPVIFFDAPLRDSGEEWPARIHSVAMTNVPFLDGMAALALSERLYRRACGEEIDVKKARKAVALSDSAKQRFVDIAKLLAIDVENVKDEDLYWTVMDALGALQNAAKVEEILDTPADGTSTTPAPAASESGSAAKEQSMNQDASAALAAEGAPEQSAIVARLLEASGMDEASLMAAIEANLEAVLAALKGEKPAAEMAEGAATAAAETAALKAALSDAKRKLDVATTELAALKPTVRELAEKNAKREADDAAKARQVRLSQIDLLIKSGQISEGSKAAYVALGDKDPAAFAESIKDFRTDVAGVPFGAEASAAADPRVGSDPSTVRLNDRDPGVIALRQRWDSLLPQERGETPETRAARIDNHVRRQLSESARKGA